MPQKSNIAEDYSPESGVLTLKNKNNKKLLKTLYDQKTLGQFCDVKFLIKGDVVQVHACILASFSSYISQMLEIHRSNKDNVNAIHCCKPLIIDLNNIIRDSDNCFDCLQKIIDFMYLGYILIDNVHINHLEILSDKLKINELILFCSRYRCKVNDVCFNFDMNKSIIDKRTETIKKLFISSKNITEQKTIIDKNKETDITKNKSTIDIHLEVDKNNIDNSCETLTKNTTGNESVEDEKLKAKPIITNDCDGNKMSFKNYRKAIDKTIKHANSINRPTVEQYLTNCVEHCTVVANREETDFKKLGIEAKVGKITVKRNNTELNTNLLPSKKIKIVLNSQPQSVNKNRPTLSKLERQLDLSLCKNIVIINPTNSLNVLGCSNLSKIEVTKEILKSLNFVMNDNCIEGDNERDVQQNQNLSIFGENKNDTTYKIVTILPEQNQTLDKHQENMRVNDTVKTTVLPEEFQTLTSPKSDNDICEIVQNKKQILINENNFLTNCHENTVNSTASDS